MIDTSELIRYRERGAACVWSDTVAGDMTRDELLAFVGMLDELVGLLHAGNGPTAAGSMK